LFQYPFFTSCVQGLVADLAARFKGEDERFNWADEGKLTADSGNVVGC
jgi:hypothetical protein